MTSGARFQPPATFAGGLFNAREGAQSTYNGRLLSRCLQVEMQSGSRLPFACSFSKGPHADRSWRSAEDVGATFLPLEQCSNDLDDAACWTRFGGKSHLRVDFTNADVAPAPVSTNFLCFRDGMNG